MLGLPGGGRNRAATTNKGEDMADSHLTKEQGLSLLARLGKDDAFRQHFELKPAEAMLDLGLPAELVCRLPAKCLCPRKLASKAELEHAHGQLASDVDTSMLVLIIPAAKF